jgi:hypothetical protein
MTGVRWTSRLCAAAVAVTVSLCQPTAGAEAAAAEPFSEVALLARPAPGPHAGFQDGNRVPRGFGASEPFVATYYFYWYDRASGMHFVDADGTDALTDHPAEPQGYSYRRPSWHRRELAAMVDAGIDVVLPVFWGNPADAAAASGPMRWSFDGLPPLVEAWQALGREGKKPPRIGLFYDTSSLRHNAAGRHVDLSSADGRAWFYVTIRDFFSLVPPPMWATVESRPIVFLYSSGFARGGADDPALFTYVHKHFGRDFGGVRPFIVAEQSWPIRADARYAWGGAFGLKALDVASLGPGYDDSAVPGRTTPRADREGGRFYERNWRRLLALEPARRPRIAAVETWNEWHEGTDIAPSREYGRQYVDMTRRFADLWRSGGRLPLEGPYASAPAVSIGFEERAGTSGLSLKTGGDGLAQVVDVSGSRAVQTLPNPAGPACYLYFAVDDSFAFGGGAPLRVRVEYLDEGRAPFGLQYDSADASALHGVAYKNAGTVTRTGSGSWKGATFDLPDPLLMGRQNLGADLRLVAPDGSLTVRRVTVTRVAAD